MDAVHRGHELRAVGGGAKLDAVVEDDALVVVGDLGLVTELDRAVNTPLADRPRIAIMQADQPGGTLRGLPGQPGPGLRHDRAGPLDRDRQLRQRPPQTPPHPPAEGPGQCAAAVAQHRGGLRSGLLRQIGKAGAHPADRRRALVFAELAAGPHLGGHLAGPPAGRPPPVCHLGARGPARCLHPPHRTHQLDHRLGQKPHIGRVSHVRRDHRGIGPHPAGTQQLLPGGLGPQRLIQPRHRLLAAPAGQLHQRGRVRHPPIERDPAKPPPGDRDTDLRAQALKPQPVTELEEHQPQVALHRRRRPPDHRVKVRHERGEEHRVIQQRVHPGQLGRQPQQLRRQ